MNMYIQYRCQMFLCSVSMTTNNSSLWVSRGELYDSRPRHCTLQYTEGGLTVNAQWVCNSFCNYSCWGIYIQTVGRLLREGGRRRDNVVGATRAAAPFPRESYSGPISWYLDAVQPGYLFSPSTSFSSLNFFSPDVWSFPLGRRRLSAIMIISRDIDWNVTLAI